MQEEQSFDHGFGLLNGVRGLGEVLPAALPLEKGIDQLTRADRPLAYALADAFTVCDAYHSSVNGASLPNRHHLFSSKVAMSHDHEGYDGTTYPERLERAGVSWQVYQEWDSLLGNPLALGNPLECFARFKTIGKRILNRGVAGLGYGDCRLFSRGLAHSVPGTLLSRVAQDIVDDTLPRVSWIIPPSPTTSPTQSDFLYDPLNLVATARRTCLSTAILITVDSDGGQHDHVPPPVPPRPESGKSADWAGGQPLGFGRRVPLTVVSPWTIGGHVNSEVFDHTSVLQLIKLVTGVREPSISDWRRQACGDLTSVFDLENTYVRAPFPPAVLTTGSLRQEPGRRRARPLRYRPSVAAAIVGDTAELTPANGGAGSAHFTIYPYAGKRALRQIHLDVDGIHTEPIMLTTKEYRLLVQGPNRFFYELTGRVSAPSASLQVATPCTVRSAMPCTVRRSACTVAASGRCRGQPSMSGSTWKSPWTPKRRSIGG